HRRDQGVPVRPARVRRARRLKATAALRGNYTPPMDETRVRKVSRRLRDLCEPIAGCVYFVPEALDGYKKLGLATYMEGYFPSRGACLGKPSGEVVTAAFGVFNPAIVIPAVDAGWSKTDPETILR